MRLYTLAVVAALLPATSFAQQTAQDTDPLFSAEDLGQVDLTRMAGPNEQVVDPELAMASFGTGSGDSWKTRVMLSPAYAPGDAAPSCTNAIKSMFKHVCQGADNCDLEVQYEQFCLSNNRSEDEKTKCLRVVRDYVGRCFGDGACGDPEALNTGLLTSQNEICTASVMRKDDLLTRGVQLEDQFAGSDGFFDEVIVTARHCTHQANDKFSPDPAVGLRCSQPSCEVNLGRRSDNTPKLNQNLVDFESNSKIGDITWGKFPPAAVANNPREFAPTIFIGYNSLAAMATKLQAGHQVAEAKKTYELGSFLCDRSPLCTFVSNSGGKIVHTCQSSKGGSGGPLLQKDPNTNEWKIVGINEGSPDVGRVRGNQAWTVFPN
jgi:hypothetical protein